MNEKKNVPRGLTEAEKQLKADILEELLATRRALLIRHPFVGSLAMRLSLTPVVDCRMTSACTDGRHLFVDAEFFKKLAPEDRLAFLGHEVWHCALRHAFRRGERDVRRFNYAADLEVDYLLQRDGFKVSMLPHEPEWLGQSAEFIYDRLLPFLVKRERNDIHLYPPLDVFLPIPANGGGSDNGYGDGNDSDDGNVSGGYGNGADNAKKGCGRKNGFSGENGGGKNALIRPGLPVISHDLVFDPDFSPFENEGRNCGDGNGGHAGGDGQNTGGGQNAGDDNIPSIAQDWGDFLRHEYMRAKGRGTLPCGIEEHLSKEMEASLDWRQLLLEYVSMLLRGERQWLPPNRRFFYRRLYLPGRARRTSIKLTVALDTSGSTANDLPQFMGELREMVSTFDEYEITVIQCDCDIHSVKTYTTDAEPFKPEEFKFFGQGGTDLRPPFEYVRKNMYETPAVMIYLTDGDGPAPEQPPDYPVIWCITPDGRAPMEWGIAIHMSSEEESHEQ